MSETGKTKSSSLPELRELVKENDRRVFNFCLLMLEEGEVAEAVTVDSFDEFGRFYRRVTGGKASGWSGAELKIRLYQIAWERIQEALSQREALVPIGRDTRQLRRSDGDLLAKDSPPGDEAWRDQFVERLFYVDTAFRAPVLLRDLLKFTDEETTRILGIRWGVYRHRLNRGRLDLRDYLRGRLVAPVGRSGERADASL